MRFLILIATISVALAANSCSFAPQSFSTYEQVYDCITQFPLNNQIFQNTMKALQMTMPMYVFRDWVKDSPPSSGLLHIQEDVLKSLEDIANSNFDLDYEMQSAIADVFLSLKDPHTTYSKPPQCYGLEFVQPFQLSSAIIEDQFIYVAGLTPFAPQFPDYQKLQSLVGTIVAGIDGEGPISHLVQFSIDQGFISKDIGSLFNYALGKSFATRRFMLNNLPKPSVTYTLAFPPDDYVNITVPWLVYNPNTFYVNVSSDCYSVSDEELKEIQQVHKRYKEDLFTNNETSFMEAIFNLMALAETFNVPNLIIDLRNNGGGDICLGYEVVDAIIGDRNPLGRYDIVHTPLTSAIMETLAKAQYEGQDFSPEDLVNPFTNKPYTNISWYLPGVNHTRANSTSTYSNLEHLVCNLTSTPPPYVFTQILILTNGLCGSTCAVFSSHMGEVDGVNKVVIGGLYNRTQQYFSFPGGEVFDYIDVLQITNSLNITDPSIVPPTILSQASFRFAFQEIYSWSEEDNPNIPLEFIFKPETYHIWEWYFASEYDLYSLVATYFEK